MSDPAKYRTKEEVECYKEQDPIAQVISVMRDNGWIDDAGVEAMEKKIEDIVNECVKFAEESPYPAPEELYNDVYAEPNYPFIME